MVAPYELEKNESIIFDIRPTLSRYGYAKVSLPGGAVLCSWPVDLHLDSSKKMGASFTIKNGYVYGSEK